MIKIENKSLCCGCNACVQCCVKQCITMYEDEEGFLYPKVDETKCIDCGLCEKVCPVLNPNKSSKPIIVYAAKNYNEEIRMKSSSGGIFTLLAEFVLEKQGVVFGAKLNEEWEVIHDYTETFDGLEVFRGSKYLQSLIGDTYLKTESFLKQGKEVFFFGTPCQIAGLKKYLGKEYSNLLCVDLVCHGVPSPLVWRKYLHELCQNRKINKSNIKSIEFRNKDKGWSGFSLKITDNIGVTYRETLDDDLYLKGFLKDLYLRPSCYNCPSKSFSSESDITIADFWGIEHVLPNFADDKGISLVFINTEKGQYVFDKLEMQKEAVDSYAAEKYNYALHNSVKMNHSRYDFFSYLYNGHTSIQSIKRFTKDPLIVTIKKNLKKILMK